MLAYICTGLIQEIKLHDNINLCIQREDLVHPVIQGNKYRKLKYNIAFAKANNYKSLLTFGGAYSNHIAATAIAGSIEGLETIGIIRGEELGENLEKTLAQNHTLATAVSCGMQLEFVSRSVYKRKEEKAFTSELLLKYPETYILPEGGTNALAIEGCKEILDTKGPRFDYVCCPVGTGGTISGIIESSKEYQKVLGFPALKGDFLQDEIKKWTAKTNWKLLTDYHFGGYAKVNTELIEFINAFNYSYTVPLDPVYTGKMMYGVLDLVEKGYFPPNSRILAIHTGGLQGIRGMNQKLLQKGLPIIKDKE